MLAMSNQNGKVFGSIPGLANRARVPIAEVEKALKKFMAPDPYSRTKDFEGRRIAEIDGGWKLLTYEKHASYRHEDERREYMRDLMRKRRAVSTSLADVSNVSHGKPQLAHADADADAEEPKSKARALRAFIPPELSQVVEYCQERKSPVDPCKFFDYYTSQGWYVGSHRMKDWKAAVRNWERNNKGGPFRDGYQKTGRTEREQLGTQERRAFSNATAIFGLASEVGTDSSPDGPGQETRPDGRSYALLEGKVKTIP